jgi:hypothetical protein
MVLGHFGFHVRGPSGQRACTPGRAIDLAGEGLSAAVDLNLQRSMSIAPARKISGLTWGAGASACPGEVDPVRRQGHAPTQESTAHSDLTGSPSDPIRSECAVGPQPCGNQIPIWRL